MKIISKIKDYYDYLQGIYGIDEKLVLDRTTYTHTIKYNDYDTIRIYLCDIQIEGMYYGGEFLYGDELKKYSLSTNECVTNQYSHYTISPRNSITYNVILKQPQKIINSPNDIENCPILISRFYSRNNYGKDICLNKYPILKDYNLNKVFTPEQVFLMLSEWLGKEKIIENNQTDKEKILSAGFDLKTSFRKM